jgi:hypothetical protein
MEYFLRRLTHLLVILTWLGAAYLIGMGSAFGGGLFLALGLFLFVRAWRRGVFRLRRAADTGGEAVNTDRQAKFMVTHVLRNLTRIQVAYLCQDFSSRKQSRAWLKQTLPKSFRSNLGELHSKLESARMGADVSSLWLAQKVYSLREEILGLEEALRRSHAEHPDCDVAHPLIFVITEHLDEGEGSQPEVITLAGWEPDKPTLLPRVDARSHHSEVDGGKKVRGLAGFVEVREALSGSISVLDEAGRVFRVEPVGDPVPLGLRIDKVPLGFVVGVAELL